MFLRHRYQSPQMPSTEHFRDREIYRLQSPELARYSSAKMLERVSMSSKQIQSAIRKRIEDYTYSLSDLIGEGYTSRVFKANKDGSKQIFAIKVVDLRKYTASNRQMLESEVNILKEMQHPNIIKCHDVFVTTNNCYIVTEYCEGGDLSTLLKRVGKKQSLPQHRFATIAKQILAGFRYLCYNDIVHRDLKPANIFFKNGVAKIADFGFAKKLQQIKIKQSYNVGTPLYMPPQALVHSKYSFQSDIFSLGVMFYEMLFGHAPWQSRTQKQLISKMTKSPIIFGMDLKPSLKQMLKGCLSIEVYERFTTERLFESEYVQDLFHADGETLMDKSQKPRKSEANLNLESISTKSTEKDIVSKQQILEGVTNAGPPAINSPVSAAQAKLSSNKRLYLDKNTSSILVQLNFCRFMYYLAKNRIPAMKSTEKDKLNLILHRHILKVIGRLTDLSTYNSLCLPGYDQYKTTSAFSKISDTVSEYSQRYKTEFANARAKQSLKYIHLIEDQLQPIAKYDMTGKDKPFFEQILLRVREMAKNLSLVLEFEIAHAQNAKILAPSIQGLKSLIKYLGLLKILIRNPEDYEYFMMHGSITVLTDYNRSNATLDDFIKLKTTAI